MREVSGEKRKMSREFDKIPLISPKKGKFSPKICALDGLTLVSNPVILRDSFRASWSSDRPSLLKGVIWSDVRVVEGGGLENRCAARYRGFESPLLRKVF